MKKPLLYFVSCMLLSGIALGQSVVVQPINKTAAYKPVYKYGGAEMQTKLLREPNPYTSSSAAAMDVNETIIGGSSYDLQTNSSVQNRIVKHGDGTISAVWTFGASGTSPSFPGRGTGYNYYDGSSWGNIPTQRIESVRTGWPSIDYSSGAGEVVMSHLFMEKPIQSKRASKGTGSWSETQRSDAPNTSWPRMVIGGNNGTTLHMIAVTLPEGNQGTIYQGQDGALLYSRSLDGGDTWDIENQLFSELDSSHYYSMGGDAYAMAAPRGNTVAFVTGESFNDVVLMKSTDNGDNWTKTVIDTFPYPLFNEGSTLVLDTPLASDGSMAVILDENGDAHVFWGALNVLNDDTTDEQYTYFPGTNGLMYWNENFGSNPPVMITGALDLDNNQILDIIGDIALYYVSLSSMPSAAIGDDGTIYLSYSAVVETLNNGNQNYRHIYMMKSTDGGQNWTEPVDVTPFDEFAECVFASIAPQVDDYVHMVYQRDFEPGLAVQGDMDAYDENEIVYLKVPKELNVGISEPQDDLSFEIYPNPAEGSFMVNLADAEINEIALYDILGNVVWQNTVNGNALTYEVTTTGLSAGTYFVRLSNEKASSTKKVIIK